jgi:hypothetical protein
MSLENEQEERVNINHARDALKRFRTNFWEYQEPPISHLHKYMMEPLGESISDEEFNWRLTQMNCFFDDMRLVRSLRGK